MGVVPAVHRVSVNNAYPADMAADSAGLWAANDALSRRAGLTDPSWAAARWQDQRREARRRSDRTARGRRRTAARR